MEKLDRLLELESDKHERMGYFSDKFYESEDKEYESIYEEISNEHEVVERLKKASKDKYVLENWGCYDLLREILGENK